MAGSNGQGGENKDHPRRRWATSPQGQRDNTFVTAPAVTYSSILFQRASALISNVQRLLSTHIATLET
jgi:hypothetical protein